MNILVTGGCGFLGTNISAEILRRGYSLTILDNLSRTGSRENLAWLRRLGEFHFCETDIRDAAGVVRIVKEQVPHVVFHFAGQVAMTTSFENPRADFEMNVLGSFNLVESLRVCAPEAVLFYSSTNKVYGDLNSLTYREGLTRYEAIGFECGFNETLPLRFETPYGCSKGAADQYILDAHKSFGLRTVVFRHSSIFGERQVSTVDQGWVGWFLSEALRQKSDPHGEPILISGNGKQVRDILFSRDLVHCYFGALEKIDTIAGEAFNIGGGMGNSSSLLELFEFLEKELEVELRYQMLQPRKSDQKVFVADTSKARLWFGWEPAVPRDVGLRQTLHWASGHGI